MLISGAKWGFFESVSTRVIGILFNLVVVWFISPEQLGMLAIFTVLHQIISIAQNFGIYDFLLFNKEKLNKLYPTCYFILIFLSLLCILLLFIYKQFFFDYSDSELITLFYLFSLSLLPGALQSIPKVKLYADKKFNTIYKIKISSFFLNKFLTIILLILGFSLTSFGISILASSIFSWICFQYKSNLKFSINTNRFKFIFDQVKYTIGYTLSRAFNNNLDFLVIGFFSTEILGIYFMAFSLSSQIVTLISTSLIKNTHAVLNDFKIGENNKDIINFLFVFSTIAFPLAFFQGFFSIPIINLFFPEKWYDCIPHILILSLASGFKISANLWIPLTKSLGRFRYLFKISITENILFFIFLFVLISKIGQYGAPIAFLLVSVLIDFSALINSLKKWKINFYNVIKNIIMSLGLTIISFIPSICLMFISKNNLYLAIAPLISLLINFLYYYYFDRKKYLLLKKTIFDNIK